MDKELHGVKKNIFYNLLYQLLTIITPLITTPHVSRALQPSGIGDYAFAYSVANYFVIFILLGLNNYGNRTIAKCRDDKERMTRTFWEIYGMQHIMGLLVLSIYVVYSLVIAPYFNSYFSLAWIMGLYVISGALDINWFYSGLEEFRTIVLRNAVIKIITTIMILVLVNDSNDVPLYTLIMAMSFLGSQIILWVCLINKISFVRIRIKDIFKHIKPNLVLFMPAIAVSIYRIMDKLMLGIMCINTEVGYYESTEKLTSIPLCIITAIGTAMLPRMANLVSRLDNERTIDIVSKSMVLSLFITSPLVLGMMSITELIVPLFFGVGYEKCIILFYIVLPSTLFIAVANVVRSQVLVPRGMDKIYTRSYFVGAIVNLLLNLILIRYMQSIGAAIATLVTEIAVCAYQLVYTTKWLNYKRIGSSTIFVSIISLLMACVVYNIPFFANNILEVLVVKIILGVSIYSLGIILYCVFSKDELLRSIIFGIIKKN